MYCFSCQKGLTIFGDFFHSTCDDSVVDRVLREIADEIEEEVIRKQLMEIDVSDNEWEDANDNEREDTSDNEQEDASDDEQEDASDDKREKNELENKFEDNLLIAVFKIVRSFWLCNHVIIEINFPIYTIFLRKLLIKFFC